MERVIRAIVAAALTLAGAGRLSAAQDAAQDGPRVPPLVRLGGELRDAAGAPRTSPTALTLSLYAEQTGGVPLWSEQQAVQPDTAGRYSVVLGAADRNGIPLAVFGSGDARWLAVRVDSEPEQPRIMLLSVPYALKAAEAERLSGRRAEDFVLADTMRETVRTEIREQSEAGATGGSTGGDPGTFATVDSIAKFTDSGGAVGDSAITETGGRVGIGTMMPNYLTQLHSPAGHSVLQFTNGTTGGMAGDGSYFGVLNGETLFRIYNLENANIEFFTNNQRRLTIGAGGNIGIGTQGPNYLTQLHSAGGHSLLQMTNATTGMGAGDGVYFGVLNGMNGFRIMNQEAGPIDLFTSGAHRVTVTAAGNVGIGTASPSSMLHVAGNAVIDGNIAAKYQDVAEWVESTQRLEPGTVVIVDPDRTNSVISSTSSYDSRVAGAISPQPGVVLGEAGPNKVLVAQSGRVRIKADAGFGRIHAGDLLVTSPRAGYAMRSEPIRIGEAELHRPGTVLGKALEPLQSGEAEILVLLTLQ